METLRIEYGTGYMELIVKRFFPCPIQKMRKIARLINEHCSDKTRADLLSSLREMAESYTALCKTYKQKMADLSEDSSEFRHLKAQFNKTEVLRKRMERNIGMITSAAK